MIINISDDSRKETEYISDTSENFSYDAETYFQLLFLIYFLNSL